ncbi:hypothetical protein IC575_031141 [Cucumis melo]
MGLDLHTSTLSYTWAFKDDLLQLVFKSKANPSLTLMFSWFCIRHNLQGNWKK